MASNPQMAFAKSIYDEAEQVDLTDPNVAEYLGIAQKAGAIASPERVAQILAGMPV